jgi:hypothetical protein
MQKVRVMVALICSLPFRHHGFVLSFVHCPFLIFCTVLSLYKKGGIVQYSYSVMARNRNVLKSKDEIHR